MPEKPAALFHGYMLSPDEVRLDELGVAQVKLAAKLWQNGEISRPVFTTGSVYPGRTSLAEVRKFKNLGLEGNLMVVGDEVHVPRIRMVLEREFGGFASSIDVRNTEFELERLQVMGSYTMQFLKELRACEQRRVLNLQEPILRTIISIPGGYESLYFIARSIRYKSVIQYELLRKVGRV